MKSVSLRLCKGRQDKAIKKRVDKEEAAVNGIDGLNEIDENKLRYRALKLCVERGQVSVSMFQRFFPIGYLRACGLVDWMEDMGYISAAEGIKPREVLITPEEFNKLNYKEILYRGVEADNEDGKPDEKLAGYKKNLQGALSDGFTRLYDEGRINV